MYLFLLPLLIGFAFNSASAFSTYCSQRLGERRGRWVCILLRDVLGIPVWAAGYAMAALSQSPGVFTRTSLTSTLAWAFVLSGLTLIIAGLVSLRWRAAAPSIKDTLVVTGLYAHIRHPLYSGLLLELAGLFLWFPSRGMLVACLLGVLWVFLQARLEELDLIQRLPAYREYMQRVPRFVPKFRE
ncbi:MAG TPA: isoprenylcysteine carboxylmethyltransferase family protein [Anaerolineales bacterium]|nr:isoprenylcysteine carboxylmethyltransferase family protein [Anaerolineales bacterium]